MDQPDDMSFLDHLEALRWHLIRSLIAIVSFAVLAFINKRLLFDAIIFAPKEADFITFKALCRLSDVLTNWNASFFPEGIVCIGQNMPPIQNISMAGQFTTHITASLVAGLVLGFPYLAFELWRFIKPGLEENERKNTRGAVFFISILFLSGVTFGYYVISPLSVNFFATYSISDSVQNLPTLRTYISTVITIVLACGVLFELPVIVYFLTKAGLISPQLLRKFRRHAFIGALILSAILTPPDVFSQLLVSVPLVILYEISIGISARILRKARD